MTTKTIIDEVFEELKMVMDIYITFVCDGQDGRETCFDLVDQARDKLKEALEAEEKQGGGG